MTDPTAHVPRLRQLVTLWRESAKQAWTSDEPLPGCSEVWEDCADELETELEALAAALASLVQQWTKPRRVTAHPVTPYPKTYQDGVEEAREACARQLAVALAALPHEEQPT